MTEEWVSIGTATRPARIMLDGDGNVRVAELLAHIAELDTDGEQMAREGVSPRTGSFGPTCQND